MTRDLEYPTDARRTIDSLNTGLRYDAAVAIAGNALYEVPLGESLDFSTGFRNAGLQEDKAVRRDAPGLLSRFSFISMVSRLEVHAQNLLLQRRVLEELKVPTARMTSKAMWAILKRVQDEARSGPVRMCGMLIVEKPSPALSSRLTWLEGIYRIRNCLAHRLGKVQMVDVKQPGTPLEEVSEDDVLQATWLRMVLIDDGKVIEELPHKKGEGDL